MRFLAGLLAAFLLFAAAPAAAEWRRAESANFVVYGETSEARLRDKVERLELFDQLLRMLTGTDAPPSPNKLHVYFVRGGDELRLVRNVAPNVAGFYAASPGAMLAMVDDSAGRGEQDNEILFHEYAHHFMMQHRPGAYPRWWVEGFAEYAMTARIGAGEVEYGDYSPMRMRLLANRSAWLPLDEVLFGDGRSASAEERGRYYAQSWLLVHYLLRDDARRAALLGYLTAIGGGEDPRTAFTAAFGDPREMHHELRAYMRTMTFTRLGRNRDAPAPRIEAAVLPASADDLLLEQAVLRLGVGDAYREAMLARVRRAAARHPEDPFARRILGQAELLHGDRAEGERLIDALLSEQPGDAELLYLRGMGHMRAGAPAEARRWFARAHRADPNHYPTLYRYAQALAGEPGHVSENSENILLLAARLAPQVAEIRLAAGRMLLARSRFDEAAAMLAPVAHAPHGGDLARQAQALLERARARAAEPAPAMPVEPLASRREAARLNRRKS